MTRFFSDFQTNNAMSADKIPILEDCLCLVCTTYVLSDILNLKGIKRAPTVKTDGRVFSFSKFIDEKQMAVFITVIEGKTV